MIKRNKIFIVLIFLISCNIKQDGKSYKVNERVTKNELSKEELDSLEALLGPENFKKHMELMNSIEDTFSVNGNSKIGIKIK